jgi:hypothetical protein
VNRQAPKQTQTSCWRLFPKSTFEGFVAFAPAFAEEDSGWRVTVGDGLDVHGIYYAHLVRTVKNEYVTYMVTFPQRKLRLESNKRSKLVSGGKVTAWEVRE